MLSKKKLNRIAYLFYCFNIRNITSPELEELQALQNEWKIDFVLMNKRKKESQFKSNKEYGRQ